jgi:hypothetical protein
MLARRELYKSPKHSDAEIEPKVLTNRKTVFTPAAFRFKPQPIGDNFGMKLGGEPNGIRNQLRDFANRRILDANPRKSAR